MKRCIPYARSNSPVQDAVNCLGVKTLLSKLRLLPPDKEFSMLLEFLAAFAGGLEKTERRMNEMLPEQAATSYIAYAEAVRKIKNRLVELYAGTTDEM